MPRLNTTISEKHCKIIEKYKDSFGSQKKIIETALELLDKQKTPELDTRDELWLRLRKECDVAAFSRQVARDIISGSKDEAIKNNYLPFFLEWFYKRPIAQLSCEEVLFGLKNLLETTNIFKSITYTRVAGKPDTIRMTGYIGMNYEASEFYSKYISYFLEQYCDCKITGFISSTGITMTVEFSKEVYWDEL